MYRIIATYGNKSISIKAHNFTVSYWDSLPKGITMKILTDNGVIYLEKENIVKIERYTDKRKR